MIRRVLVRVLELAGVGCLVGAAWRVSTVVGLAASGVALLVAAWLITPEPTSE